MYLYTILKIFNTFCSAPFQFSIVECILSAFTDEFPNQLRGRWQSVAFRSGVILFTFLMGLPMVTSGGIHLLNLVDYSVSGFPLLVVGALELIALNWIYGRTTLRFWRLSIKCGSFDVI